MAKVQGQLGRQGRTLGSQAQVLEAKTTGDQAKALGQRGRQGLIPGSQAQVALERGGRRQSPGFLQALGRAKEIRHI